MNKKLYLFCLIQLQRIKVELKKIFHFKNPYEESWAYVKAKQRESVKKEAAHQLIAEAIENKVPYFVGRYGIVESEAVFYTEAYNSGLNVKKWYERCRVSMSNNAGFFSNSDEALKEFVKICKEAGNIVDIFYPWYLIRERYLRKYLLNDHVKYTEGNRIMFMSCMSVENPWTKALTGKRVLVVSSFADTIEKQYREKRELIWPSKYVLPEFSLRAVKAIQTSAGNRDERFDTWFDALDYMTNECLKEDFDVAVIGCGSYGYPLAARIKQAGKVAIVAGGEIQLWFGIRGKRWENELVSKYFNDAWVYPDDSERIKNADAVEGGCYW